MIMTRALFTQVSCQLAALDWQRAPGSVAVLPPSEGLPTFVNLRSPPQTHHFVSQCLHFGLWPHLLNRMTLLPRPRPR